jgi:hypothetical protein
MSAGRGAPQPITEGVEALPCEASLSRDTADSRSLSGGPLVDLSLALRGFLVVTSGRAALAREPLLGLSGPLLLGFCCLGVLIGGGGVGVRSLATGPRLAAQLLGLGGVRVRLLPMSRGLGGESLTLAPLLLGAPLCPAPRNERDHRDRDHDDDN